MLFIGKPKGRSRMISNRIAHFILSAHFVPWLHTSEQCWYKVLTYKSVKPTFKISLFKKRVWKSILTFWTWNLVDCFFRGFRSTIKTWWHTPLPLCTCCDCFPNFEKYDDDVSTISLTLVRESKWSRFTFAFLLVDGFFQLPNSSWAAPSILQTVLIAPFFVWWFSSSQWIWAFFKTSRPKLSVVKEF